MQWWNACRAGEVGLGANRVAHDSRIRHGVDDSDFSWTESRDRRVGGMAGWDAWPHWLCHQSRMLGAGGAGGAASTTISRWQMGTATMLLGFHSSGPSDVTMRRSSSRVGVLAGWRVAGPEPTGWRVNGWLVARSWEGLRVTGDWPWGEGRVEDVGGWSVDWGLSLGTRRDMESVAHGHGRSGTWRHLVSFSARGPSGLWPRL